MSHISSRMLKLCLCWKLINLLLAKPLPIQNVFSANRISIQWSHIKHNLIKRYNQRYSNMLWNMWSITRHKRSYGHPLHPDLTPDVLTCVLPLGTVSSGREIEVESAHLFLTIIQFFSACHLTSQHTGTCTHNSIISHSPTHYKSPVVMGEWRSSRCRIHW